MIPISEQDLLDIEMFLSKEMSQKQRLAFKSKMEANVDLREAVKQFSALITGIETAAIKEKMKDFHAAVNEKSVDENFKTPQINNRKKYSYLSLAASFITIALILFSGWWLLNQPSENERLFADYFSPDPGLITPMSATENFKFFDAMVDYKQKNYKSAIVKWETLLQTSPKNDTLNYFLGVARLAEDDPKKAISNLEKTITSSESVFKNDAYFYLGLAYLKINNTKEAIKALEKSSLEESTQVLEELKSR